MRTLSLPLPIDFHWRNLLLGAAAIGLGMTTSQAAVFFGTAAATSNSDFNVTGNWNSAVDGSGSAPSGMAGNDFIIAAGRIMGTGSGDVTFLGTSLTVSGTFFVRNANVPNATKTVATLNTQAGSTIYSNITNRLLVSGTTAVSGATNLTVQAATVSPTFNFGTLTGSGNLTLAPATGGNNILTLDATSASGYTGTIGWSGAGANIVTLDFGSGLTFGGGLVASDTNARINLDQNVTFASVTLNGTSLTAGTYLYSDLNTSYDTLFVNGGSGSITVVPEPATAVCFLGGFGVILLARRRLGCQV